VLSAAETKDHAVIKPIPDSTLEDTEFKQHSSYEFEYEQDAKEVEKNVKGKHWFFYYELNKEADVSELEIIENFKQAALEKGGKILKEDDTKLDFTVPLPDGGTLWVHLHAWVNSYELNIIEEKAFKKQLVFGADEMKRKLDTAGQVSIYGIHFDVDKSTLKPGSEKVLMEIVKLLKGYPDLKIEIQGHTDSQGSKDYNLKLSERRAQTVKSFLIIYGIDASRMITKGYGPDKPVTSNETDEGRALNRRVELKKM
jgi:outer membrane protein OmpA-like peptidoglycan-associated protein